jgi:hypothetical protein
MSDIDALVTTKKENDAEDSNSEEVWTFEQVNKKMDQRELIHLCPGLKDIYLKMAIFTKQSITFTESKELCLPKSDAMYVYSRSVVAAVRQTINNMQVN